MKKAFIILLLSVITIPLYTKEERDRELFDINKSFELFGSVYRELSRQYVEELEAYPLIVDGIKGMLSGLDPYTVYMDENDIEDIDMLTSGTYIGFGITVGTRDSMLTITGLAEGYSAEKNGIRIGDRIYRIDSSVVININADHLRKYTRGASGSKADFYYIRDGLKDTVKVTLERSEISVNNVTHYEVMDDSVAYIKLERFSRLSALEVKNAFRDLNSDSDIKALILDLRDNPGGLLDAAVELCELFLPNDKLVVSTIGRSAADRQDYYSNALPLDTLIPLAVLINGHSASASEIVAGAVQDLDRGIIVGERSYGKGLVQSVFSLPFNSSLKITTARYYTPSGRCIQRIQYKNNHNAKGDSVYYTSTGRAVYESFGIKPDSCTKQELPGFIKELLAYDFIFKFANLYASDKKALPEKFKVDDFILEQFVEYLSGQEFKSFYSVNDQLDVLKKLADRQKLDKSIMKQIEKLHKMLEKGNTHPVFKYSKELAPLLENEIKMRFYPDSRIISDNIHSDKDIRVAIELLKEKNYKRLLSLSETD